MDPRNRPSENSYDLLYVNGRHGFLRGAWPSEGIGPLAAGAGVSDLNPVLLALKPELETSAGALALSQVRAPTT